MIIKKKKRKAAIALDGAVSSAPGPNIPSVPATSTLNVSKSIASGGSDSRTSETCEEGRSTGAAEVPGTASAGPAPPGDDVDPLDAFMEQHAAEPNEKVGDGPGNGPPRGGADVGGDGVGGRPPSDSDDDDDSNDPAGDYVTQVLEKAASMRGRRGNRSRNHDGVDDEYGEGNDGGDDDDDDEDGEERAKDIEPLPPVDHSQIDYPPMSRGMENAVERAPWRSEAHRQAVARFMADLEELAELGGGNNDDESRGAPRAPKATNAEGDAAVAALRRHLDVRVLGTSPPCPLLNLRGACPPLPPPLVDEAEARGYASPTAIQAQALPASLEGRDVVGIAKTGSGKTVAYLWPCLAAAKTSGLGVAQRGDGPSGLIIAPTRELAQQVHAEARRFGRLCGLTAVPVFGGMSKYEQCRALARGCDVVVGTPGRLIDIAAMGNLDLTRCVSVVLDEADRMLEMGFERQVRSLLARVRPDARKSMFSATFRPAIERLTSDFLADPVRIVVGKVGAANADVTQRAEVFDSDIDKAAWLVGNIPDLVSSGPAIVFCAGAGTAAKLAATITAECGVASVPIHGGLDQASRLAAVSKFRSGKASVLVGTDVVARGFDVPSVMTVVSYDPPGDAQSHTHRIGRTGRAGNLDGVAITLLVRKRDGRAASIVAASTRGVGGFVSKDLDDEAGAWEQAREAHNNKRQRRGF